MFAKIALVLTTLRILNRGPLSYLYHEYSIMLGGIGMLLLVIAFFADAYVYKKKGGSHQKDFKVTTTDVLVLLFVLWIVIRSILNPSSERFLVGSLLYFGFLPAYIYTRLYKIKPKEVIFFFSLVFIYLTFFGYFQWITAAPLSETLVRGSAISLYPMRIHATLGSNLHFGIIYTLSLFGVSIYTAIYKHKYLITILLQIIALPLIVGTSSRGGMVLWAVLALVLLIRLPWKTMLSTILCGALLLVAVNTIAPQYTQSVFSHASSTTNTSEPSNDKRIGRYETIYNYLTAHPNVVLFGTGIGYTGNIVDSFGMTSLFNDSNIYSTESYHLKLILEVGVIGLILFYALVFNVLHNAWKKLRDPNRINWIFFAVFCIVLGVFIHCITLQSLEIPMVAFMFWLAVGLSNKDYYIKEYHDKR